MTHCVLDHSCLTGEPRNGDDVISKTKPVIAIVWIRTVHVANTKHEHKSGASPDEHDTHVCRLKWKLTDNANGGSTSLLRPRLSTN
jgi:hypothetical protein